MSGILRPLEHMSLLILDVCLRGESDPVPVAQSSGKFDQSSPTGLQDPQDLQKLGPGSTQTQLLLFPRIRSACLYGLPLGSVSSLLFRDRVSHSLGWLEFPHRAAKECS